MNFNMGGMNMHMIGVGGPHSPYQSMDFAEEQYTRAKTSVWWDIENCPVPKSSEPHTIAQNISSALFRLNYCGPLSVSAYGDTTTISSTVQRALNSTGISLNHVPRDAKDASDKKILVDMLFWAVDNPAPANFLLISGDRDFSNALHQLRMRRYNILLAQPPKASAATLLAAAKTVWLWSNLSAGGPPTSNVDSPPMGYNGYGFSSAAGPAQPSDSFHQNVHVEEKNVYKFTCEHGKPAIQSGVCLRKCRKRGQRKGNQLAPQRDLCKKPVTPKTPKPPVCNYCQKSHFGPCRDEKGVCHNCRKHGHLMRDCPMERQGQDKTPGPPVAMIQGGGKEQTMTPEPVNLAGDESRVCFKCSKYGHVRRDCPMEKQEQNNTPGPAVAMIQLGGKEQNMTPEPALPVNQAGDVEQNMTPEPLLSTSPTTQAGDGEQDISPKPVLSFTQAVDRGNVMTPKPMLTMTQVGDADQDITPVPMYSVINAGYYGHSITPQPMFTYLIPKPVQASDKGDPSNSTGYSNLGLES